MPDGIGASGRTGQPGGIWTQMAGRLGGRTVEQGTSSGPRLDRIAGRFPSRGNIFARLFESRSTRLDRTATSLDQNAGQLFRTLQRPAGRALDTRELLTDLKTLRNHFDRLAELSGTRFDRTEALQAAAALQLEGMDNRTLVSTYRAFLSEDMDRLRGRLEQEAYQNPANLDAKRFLEDLGTLEATILMEVSLRVARSRGAADAPPLRERLVATASTPGKSQLVAAADRRMLSRTDQTRHLSDRNLESLVGTGARSATERFNLRPEGAGRLARKGFAMSLREVGDAIRRADMTVNFSLRDFFGVQRQVKPIESEKGLRNMFQWGVRPDENPGAQKRDLTERLFFPNMERDPLVPDERPVYAAANVGRMTMGGARAYGSSYFVLKDHVKPRCTFTRDDTFNVALCRVDRTTLQAFTEGLDRFIDKLSTEARDFLRADNGAQRQKLIDFFARQTDTFSVYGLEQRVDAVLDHGVSKEDADLLAVFAQSAFVDRQATQAQVVGFEDVESLVTHLSDERLTRMMQGVSMVDRRNVHIGNYIEAQVHGPVSFSEDVAAMRVSLDDLESVAREAGISRQEAGKKLQDFCSSRGIELSLYDENEVEEHDDDFAAFSRQHEDPEILRANREALTQHLARLLDPLATGSDSVADVLDEVGRNLQFQPDLKPSDLEGLRRRIEEEARRRSDNGRREIGQGGLRSLATDLARALLIDKRREATEAETYRLIDPGSGGEHSLAGIVQGVAEQLHFGHPLNRGNLEKLGGEVLKAVTRASEKGAHPVNVQAVAARTAEAFIRGKLDLLHHLDGLTWAQERHKAQFQQFVLGSTTLTDTRMLDHIHHTADEGRLLIGALTSAASRNRENTLELLLPFVRTCDERIMAYFTGAHKDMGRDDRLLFTERALSLAITNLALPRPQLQDLYAYLTGEAVRNLKDALIAGSGGNEAATMTNMADALSILTRMVGRELGLNPAAVDRDMAHAVTIRKPQDIPPEIRRSLQTVGLE